MTHIENAIREAVENGFLLLGRYHPPHDSKDYEIWMSDNLSEVFYLTKELRATIFLDPAFWQALGKAKGWKTPIDPDTGEEMLFDPSEVYDQEIWKDNWHRFIDHLAGGKDAESFFKDL